MRIKISLLMGLLVVSSYFSGTGCKSSSAALNLTILTARWYLEHDQGGFGYILLRIGGYSNGDRVTILTYGDGIISEKELQLDENLRFDSVVTIAFSHAGFTPPVQGSTVVTAYRGSEERAVKLQSGDIY